MTNHGVNVIKTPKAPNYIKYDLKGYDNNRVKHKVISYIDGYENVKDEFTNEKYAKYEDYDDLAGYRMFM